MRWMTVKQRESLNEFSYATYIYNIIVNDFLSRGGIVCELQDDEKLNTHTYGKRDTLYVVDAPDDNEIMMKLWYAVHLPKIIKQLNVEKIIYLNGLLGSHKMIRQPQIMMLFGMEYFINPKKATRWQQLSLKRIAQNVTNASLVFTYSASAIDTLGTILNVGLSAKIKTLQPVPHDSFKILSWEDKELTKEKFSKGCEYFLLKSSGDNIDEILIYLKAFSYFKKWQNSSMKLIMLMDVKIINNIVFKEMLDSYYFRDDIILFSELSRSEYHLLLASAYGFLMLTGRDSDLPYVFESLQCNTLVMTFDSPSIRELAKDAPYFIEGKSFSEIGQAMIDVYKSENMRLVHIRNGLHISSSFSYESNKNILMNWLQES
ncbi:hypothetical protein [Arachidicoccus sp.]|uniref:hypothetical protein n=1 Tax=Arachidicoccus sp. TaxID=1872624 RepID=UPI003D21C033